LEERWWAVAALGGVIAVIAEGIVLTFTRAGLLTMGAAVLVVGALSVRRSGLGNATLAIALVGVVVGADIFTSRSAHILRLRMTTESQDTWYQAEIEAPLNVALKTGAVTMVPVTVTNRGLVTWDPAGDHPFRFSYHWLREDGVRVVEWEGMRTLLPSAVPAGATVQLHASVRAPGEAGGGPLLCVVGQSGPMGFSRVAP